MEHASDYLRERAEEYVQHANEYEQARLEAPRDGHRLGYDIIMQRESAVMREIKRDLEERGCHFDGHSIFDRDINLLARWGHSAR